MPAVAPARGDTGFRRLVVATTAATLLLVALGGLVRGTDSGLACPDWPRCFGTWVPMQGDLPPGYRLLNVWIEHTHRLVASVVGLLVLAIVVWAVRGHRNRGDIVWPAVVALVLVTVQAWIGGQVVLGLLDANLVTAHLAMAMAVVACLVYLTVNTYLPRAAGAARRGRRLGFARLCAAVAALCYVQMLVGSTVTGLGAGLAFRDFPLMDGALVPPIPDVDALVHALHRWLAAALVVAVVVLSARAARQPIAALRKLPMWVATLVVVQVALGAANLLTELSTPTDVAHLTVATWIWSLLVLTTTLAYRWAPVASAAPTPPPAPAHAEVRPRDEAGRR